MGGHVGLYTLVVKRPIISDTIYDAYTVVQKVSHYTKVSMNRIKAII